MCTRHLCDVSFVSRGMCLCALDQQVRGGRTEVLPCRRPREWAGSLTLTVPVECTLTPSHNLSNSIRKIDYALRHCPKPAPIQVD